MAERLIKCAKLGKELPAIDEETNEGEQALKMCLLIGSREFADRVRDNVSAEAWSQWIDHQVMVVNEYRLDPTSDASNAILQRHMEAFFFGEQMGVDNYVPPESGKA
ncbi:MAG: Fe(2+)-trafficking protein [Planctomycetes bacterium]|nr:Fe(2+)-trafficking protein [Planctomycetota bacterium]